MTEPGRSLWAALHLLDRQVLDRDGTPVAKVDDLDFVLSDERDGLPVLTDLLCGSSALARRLHRRAARGLELLRRVILPVAEPGPARITMGAVTDIGTAVTIASSRHDLDVSVADRFLADHVLAHLPGSGIRRGDAR